METHPVSEMIAWWNLPVTKMIIEDAKKRLREYRKELEDIGDIDLKKVDICRAGIRAEKQLILRIPKRIMAGLRQDNNESAANWEQFIKEIEGG